MTLDFRREHLMRLRLQPAQARLLEVPGDEELGRIESGLALTGMEGDDVVFCCGVYRQWPCTVLWAALSDRAAHYLTRITRIGQRLVALQHGMGWVVAGIQNDFPEAKRWIEMLGFKLVHPGDPLSIYGRMV